MTYIGSSCFSRGLILAQAMLQMANKALEIETALALHFLIMAFVMSSLKEVVGTTVWRIGSFFLGKACPPYDYDSNGGVWCVRNNSQSACPNCFESQQVQSHDGMGSAHPRSFPLNSLEERGSVIIFGQWKGLRYYGRTSDISVSPQRCFHSLETS
jgi:hypothetical protein